MKTCKISHPIPANFFNPGLSDLSTPSSGIESMARSSRQNVPVRRTSAGVRLPGGINGSVVAPCCSARHHSAFNVIPAFCIPATDAFQNECYVLLSYSTHSAFQRSAPHVFWVALTCVRIKKVSCAEELPWSVNKRIVECRLIWPSGMQNAVLVDTEWKSGGIQNGGPSSHNLDLIFWNAECSSCGYRMEVQWNTEWRSIVW